MALAAFTPEEFRPGAHLRTGPEPAAAASTIATTIFHPAGTCTMGRSDERWAVVESP